MAHGVYLAVYFAHAWQRILEESYRHERNVTDNTYKMVPKGNQGGILQTDKSNVGSKGQETATVGHIYTQ